MKTMRHVLHIGAIAVVAAMIPSTALAQATDTTSVTLTGGTLSVSAAPLADNFPATALTGATQTLTTNFNDWRINDATGSGAGWNVTMSASQFSDGATTPKTLPTSSLKLKAPLVTAVDTLNLATAPVAQGAAPWTIDTGTAVKVFSAAANTGQGEWNMNHVNLSTDKDLVLTVPANASAATYTSTITTTLTSGP